VGRRRTFPNTPIGDSESVTFDDATFTVIDLGPSESPHDSPWTLGRDERIVFLGDQIYDHRHCYLADGHHAEWLANIEHLRERFPSDAVLHIGHGGPVGPGVRLAAPLHRDLRRGRSQADWSSPQEAHTDVVVTMKRLLPTDELLFLMELSIEPVAAQLGLTSPA
jgi:hypothetical protein